MPDTEQERDRHTTILLHVPLHRARAGHIDLIVDLRHYNHDHR